MKLKFVKRQSGWFATSSEGLTLDKVYTVVTYGKICPYIEVYNDFGEWKCYDLDMFAPVDE